MKRFALPLLLAVMTMSATAQQQADPRKYVPVDFSQVSINDSFWSPRLERLATTTLQVCIDQSENKTRRIDNFKRSAGVEQGKFEGTYFDDSDVYKMIEGIAYSLKNRPDPQLEAHTDQIIDYIAGAQRDDGYLMNFYILGDMSKRWTDMSKHEMYCAGHMIEAGIAYKNATGKDKLLQTAIRFADHIDRTFGPGKRTWIPGHQEIELALVKLYHATGQRRYLDLAHWLLEQRGRAEGNHEKHNQGSVPAREQREATGHAVRAMYYFSGMADVAVETGDKGYFEALDRLWDDVAGTKMYITGGIGSTRHGEAFGYSYELPNLTAYCETCAAIGMVFWNHRMGILKGEAKYIDVLERSMYNGVLSGISLSGDHFFYVNPLESEGKHHRQEWYGCACCPSNLDRFIPSIGNYIYGQSADALWVNLFIGSETTMTLGDGTPVSVKQTGEYPWKGNIRIAVDPKRKAEFALRVRIPAWCKEYDYRLNRSFQGGRIEDGYLVLQRTWKKGDVLDINFAMPIEVVAADPRVKADEGKRALMRGPLVYCAEAIDNPGAETKLTDATVYTEQFQKSLLDGVETIDATTHGKRLRFIPYYAWDNREAGWMKVWIDYSKE